MRRDKIVQTIRQVRKDIEANSVITSMQRSLGGRSDSESSTGIEFSALRNLFSSWERLSEDQKAFVKSIELDKLYDPDFWQAFTQDAGDRSEYIDLYQRALFFSKAAVSLANSLSQIHSENALSAEGPEVKAKIKLVIPEESNRTLSAAELAKLLSSLQDLYVVSLVSAGLEPADLIIAALDSGSDKVLVFEGLGDGIRAFGEIIFEIWNRVANTGFGKQQANLALIGKNLDVVERLNELEKSGALGKEEAEILRRQLVETTEAITTIGVITSTQEDQQIDGFRSLTFHSRKLLSPPIQTSEDSNDNEASTPHGSEHEITKEEYDALRKRLDELEGQPSAKPRSKPKRKRPPNK